MAAVRPRRSAPGHYSYPGETSKIPRMFQTAFFRAFEAVFALVAPSTANIQGLATAFCLADGSKRYYVSVAHAVGSFGTISLVRTLQGHRSEYPFEVERLDPNLDLALLKPRSAPPEGRALHVASGPAQYGMSACVVGYPVTVRSPGLPPMLNLRIAGGTVASDIDLSSAMPVHFVRARDAFEIDQNLHPGFSGAPVLDVTGGVLGAVSHAFCRPAAGGGAVTIQEVDFTVCVGLDSLAKFLGAR
ncbi:MAG: S1 family peptidase [Terriglobales bacterium]